MPDFTAGIERPVCRLGTRLPKMGARKGCYQCSKRRIICDMGEPRCLKCMKRGLECSGNGIRYRFNVGIASRGRLTGLSTPVTDVKRPSRPPSPNEKSRSRRTADKRATITRKGNSDAANQSPQQCPFNTYRQMPVLPWLEPLNAHSRFLFNHCTFYIRQARFDHFLKLTSLVSWNIASGMVILDGANNGYRNLLLPFALQDSLAQDTVISVAEYHLAQSNPGLQCRAADGRRRILERLKRQASVEPPALTTSTWVALLVLLVGEVTIAGDHYPYLLRMMASLQAHGIIDGNTELTEFLHSQTALYVLNDGPPLVVSLISCD